MVYLYYVRMYIGCVKLCNQNHKPAATTILRVYTAYVDVCTHMAVAHSYCLAVMWLNEQCLYWGSLIDSTEKHSHKFQVGLIPSRNT